MEHPAVATTPCSYCQTWLLDIKTGKVRERRGVPQRRPDPSNTPCHECPKGSPEKAAEVELASANFMTIERFLQIRASSGAAMTEEERGDAFFQHLLALCDVVFRSHDRHLNLLAFDAAVHHVRPGAIPPET